MKQLKFLMVAFTLLMGVSFTSCLNDDAGESMYDGCLLYTSLHGFHEKKNKENLCFPCNLCFREFCVIPCLKNRKRILVLTYPLKSERGFWVCFSIAVYTSAAVSVAFGCASAVRLR